MGKFYKILLLSCFFVVSSLSSYAQTIGFIRFNNSASYTPGSGVSVIINPTGVFDLNNQFVLELSNPGGTFTTPTVLNTLNEFYVPAINGVLPNSLAAGTYKLRVRSTNPVLSVETNSFNVVNGGGIGIPKFRSLLENSGNSSFNCLGENCNNNLINNIFGKINASAGAITSSLLTDNSNALKLRICDVGVNNLFTAMLIDINTSNVINLPINLTNNEFLIPDNLAIGSYVIELEKKNSNNISVFSNIFLFHGNSTNLNNLNDETVCVGNDVDFSIDYSLSGIGRNYKGSKYTIDFGDGSPNETYTQAQLINKITTTGLRHTFNNVSCSVGTSPNIGFFIVQLKLFNKGVYNSGSNNNYCDIYYQNGNGTEKKVNTNRAPIADFNLPIKQCINTTITALNTTVLGQYGTTSCLTTPRYYWYVKKPTDAGFELIDSDNHPSWLVGNDLIIPSNEVNIPGCWEIKLEAKNFGAGCQTITVKIKTIKIEAIPTPTFTNSPQSPICAGTSILFTNTSNVLNLPCQEPTYSWTVTPVAGTPATSSGYQFVAPTDASSQNANILFTQPGSYSVVLNVTNSCGTFPSTPRIIEVFGDPTVSFNPNTLTICDAAPAGYTIDFSQVGTTPTYSVVPFAPTNFTWTVSGPGVTPADYSFVGGTNANSQYPKINFTAYKTYIITVQVNGNCAGSNQASFTFILKEMPVITNTNLTQTICTGGTTSPINLASSMASGTVFNWVVTATNGITGFTTPGTGNIIPGVTLINPSNTSGTVTYTVTPSNNGCIGTPINFVITVNPTPLVPAQAITTCSGNAFTVSLSNNPPSVILPLGTTFTWTVTSPGGITGASNQTTPVSSIGQTLVNTTNAPIDVIYTITASTGSASSICTSNFTLTVTVNPRPQIPNQTLSVCSGTAFNLSLSNNPPSIILPSGTTYTWTVTAPAGITGASNQNTPISTIGQTLLNSTSNPINVIYNITATSGSGINTCSNSFTLTVTVNPAPSATISGNSSVCQNSNAVVITFTGLNGVAPYTFTYSINGGSNQTITTTSGNSVTLIAPTSILGTFNYCLLGVVDSSSSSCLNTSNSCVTVIVNPLPTVSTQPTTTQSICVGGTIDPLTVAYIGGVGTATYQWYSNTTNANSGGTLIAGATNASYTPAVFTTAGTYYFYATITLSGNGCGSTTSNTAQVIVVSDPIVDTQALATQTLCQSSTPTDLTITVSGGIGTFAYQWYSNTTNSTTGGTLITSATNATFTPPTATVGTQYYYCVVTQSGVGCNVTSAVSTVIIVAAPAITTQPASSSVCENGTPAILTVAYTNGTGTPTYQWFSNTTNSTIGGTAIAGATTASYSPPATTVGTLYYYCQITFSSGGCTSVLSNTAQVVINPLPTVSTQPTTTQSICVGGTIAPLTVGYTGGVGTATYQWYSNTTNANSGGTLIAGATNSSYTPAAFTTAGTYYFYATITLSGNGCGSTTSNTAQVIVVADPIVNTQALATQTLCQNSTPTDLTINVSGGIGTFAYQWYSNTTNSTTGGTLIPGATNATFTPPTATVGTQYYYCVVTQSGVGCNVTSAVSTVIIVPAPAITTQPASSSVCENGTPTLLTVAYTNGTGTPTYQWFSNTTNSTIGGTAIAGATTASYNPPATTVGTLYYYCQITFSSGGCTSVLSNTAQVVINPLPTVSTQPTTTQSICVGGTIAPLTVGYTGGVGTATYQWYSNTTNANSGGTLIAGATNSSYTPAAFTTAGTYYFYATITLSGNGCGSTTSNTAQVIVVADPIVNTQALATQTLCQNSTPTDLTINVSGGIGTFAYQWYSNTTSSTTGGTLITGATNATFTPPTATVGTQYYYCVVTQSGVGCNVTSAVSTVIIVPAPAITTQPASSSVCENGTPTLLTVAYTNGTGTPTYQWFSNTTNSTIGGTAIAGATTASYNPPASTVGTLYYYCQITFSSGGCTSVLSNTAEVVINPLPTVSTQPTTTQSICVGGTIDSLTVAYTGGVGTPTYQWYSNTTNANSGGTLIAGATNSSYTPAAFTTAGTYYFYATITLSGNGCGSTTSNTAQVIVVADPIVNTQALATQTLCQNSTPTDLTINVSGGIGTFAYQWYSNTTNSTTGGTLIPGATNATFTPPTATVGTQYYYCVVTQSGVGCNVTSAVSTVIIVPAPAITTQPASSSVCENGTPTLLTVAYTNGTGTPTYQWFSNTTNSTIGGTAIPSATTASYNPPASTVGTLYYYCQITFSSGGCTSVLSNTAEVVINPLPTVSTQPTTTQSICVGGTIDPLTVTYIGGVGTATYQWYSNTTNANSGGTLIAGATNSSYTPTAFTTAGTYYFYATITLSGNGCGSTTSNTAQVIVVADPIVDTQALATQTLCQNSTPTDLTINVSSGIGTFAYQWYSNTTNSTTGGTLIPGATNATFTPPTATVGTQYYYCVVTQSGVGCNVTSAVSTVIIVPAPAITTQPASSSVCENGTPAILTVAYTNGTGTPTYQWFSNTTNSAIGGTAIAGATTASYSPPATTVGTLYYYCEITFSSGGCTSVLSDTAQVVINQIPVINNVTAIICSGEQYIFNSTNSNDVLPAGLQYSWNLVSMTPTGTVSGSVNNGTLQNQFIQQLVNNSNGITTLVYEVTPIAGICTGNTFTVTIDVYPKPDVTFDIPIQTICNETNTSLVTLNSSLLGNITYNWTATIPTGITGAIGNGTNIIPVQTLTNAISTPLTITYSATATFNNNGSSCEGDVYNYSITVNPTFISTGVVSNYNGYNVSVFGVNDGSINLTTVGGSGTYTYNWTGPNGYTSTNEDVSGLFAGAYTVTINDGYCTPIILTFTLRQPPELLIQSDLSLTKNLKCFGDSDGAVGVLITQESVSPYDYELYDSNGNLVTLISDSTNLNPQFTGLIAGVYSLTVIDANGGRKTVTGLTVSQPDDIIITATTTPITCYGANNASITLTVSGGTGPFQAQWDNLATGLYQNNLAAGDYSILLTDANGCVKTIVVTIPEAPIFDIRPLVKNISCHGANDGSIVLNFVGGIAPVNLIWSDGSSAGTTRNNLGPGTYSVVITDSKPCTISRTFVIMDPQELSVDAVTTQPLDCSNAASGAINLNVSGGTPPFTYLWSNGATTEDLLGVIAGNYSVTVKDVNGCSKQASYTLTRPSPLVLTVDTNTLSSCEDRTVEQYFTAQVTGGVPPHQFTWSSGNVSGINNQTMTTSQDGLILLQTTDAIGCSASYSFDVTIPKLGYPSFNYNSKAYLNYGIYSINDPIQFTNTSTGDFVSIVWDFGDGSFSNELNPVHTYVNPKDYVVTQTVTYPFGCIYVQTISLQIGKGYVLVVPTAFTPNNDTINDTFRPVTRALNTIKLEVYDSWGSLIFSETGDGIRGWDGKIKGDYAENGNYFCVVSAETLYGTIVTERHPFVLIK